MRLISFERDGMIYVGAWIENDRIIVDLARATTTPASFANMQKLIEAGERVWDEARAIVSRAPEQALIETAAVKLLAPRRYAQAICSGASSNCIS